MFDLRVTYLIVRSLDLSVCGILHQDKTLDRPRFGRYSPALPIPGSAGTLQ